MPNKFVPLKTNDVTSTLVQQNISKALDPISNNPILNGNHQSASVTGNDIDTPYNHNLGTANVGFWVGTSTHPVQAYLSPNNSNPKLNPTPNQTTLLRFSSNQTLSTTNPAAVTVHFYEETN